MSFRSNVVLLACCQALLLTNAVTLVSVGALAGYALAHDKVFATAPAATYVLGALLGTFPASLWMRRVGRRNGFLTGGVFGLAGSALATYAIHASSLTLLCAGSLLLGVFNAFGQYYRFAAADVAPAGFRPKAISYVMAGGLVGGIVGPEISKYTRAMMEPTFMATYASLFVFCALSMAIVSRLRLPPPVEAASGGPARGLGTIARQPVFLVAAGVAALGYGTMNLLMTATPLAMGFCGLPYAASATVIASHVVAMFAPSFFTGSLIKRFGVLRVMLTGAALQLACVGVALSGQLIAHFWWALVLLGLGWNFMYIGGTTLLTEAYRASEKAKAQGANEMVVFAVQAISAFSSGVLVNARGWATLNYVALPLILVAAAAVVWLMAQPRAVPAAAD
ncbi:MAG TPA: MFS transporter [Usitatibacter sp.]|jgi:MFS family permease|nr:MFS transporter [Usitatibacter sp.]